MSTLLSDGWEKYDDIFGEMANKPLAEKKVHNRIYRKLENIGILFVYNTKDNALNIRVPSLKSKFNLFP